ncbi:hypothetical protein, partial [Pseudomonas citronellolis]|uniref:hypothetical protein n=1 Tax=Pseudomonas citronellolis TaxID=53408 RepID=UPI00248DAF1D
LSLGETHAVVAMGIASLNTILRGAVFARTLSAIRRITPRRWHTGEMPPGGEPSQPRGHEKGDPRIAFFPT